ncbi:hypothetical protein L3Y34_017807 [Caenorhabditis briggsae]|uniref:Uncharacterized protein n=1 Tax=Caenorhabditis briggsae TaxID=6238 RepID=A0AAE9IUB1_CAEBR|nr:hypothetical protein L3Y34_017807 [Caenorhabditis briggsae]
MILRPSIFLLFFTTCLIFAARIDLQNTGGDDSEEEELDEQLTDKKSKSMYEFLYKRLNQEVVPKKKLAPAVYTIPGPQEPLPGRSHPGDYWPVFPFQNQYSGGLDLDPSISRHIGGDLNIAVPSWGVLDIYGRFFNRIHDTTSKFGYVNHPVNMLDLEKEDFVKLMSDPAVHANRMAHPTLPLGKFAKTYVPLNCKPPLCNPYQMNFGLGIEHDWGGSDGVEGDIDVPIPISKGMAYRMPFGGKVYYNRENVTVTYGQNLGPIEPFSSLFDYQKHRDPALAIPRRWTRSIREPVEMQRPMTNTRKEMTMPEMAYMLQMEDFAHNQYEFMQKVPEYWLQPPPIYDARQFYPTMMVPQVLFLLVFLAYVDSKAKLDLQNQGEVEEEDDDTDNDDGPQGKDVYSFLASRMNQDLGLKKRKKANIYKIPGPQEPLPGRSHDGDYWPVFPFQNQFSGGLDLDPSTSRHIGGDMNFAVPSWGMLDIYGRFYNRVQDTMTKFGYLNHPVNMLDLEKEDFVKLMSDPAVQANRRAHPTLPMGKFGKQYMPMSCKPPLCNPYHMNFMLGIEHEWGGSDGMEGDIDVAVPMSKGVAYRFPFSGNLYYNRDNMTVHYGQNLSPIDPFASLFDYQKNRDPALANAVPRRWPRSIREPVPDMHKNIGQVDRNMYEVPFQMAMMPILNTPPFYNAFQVEPRPMIPLRRAPPRRRRHVVYDPRLPVFIPNPNFYQYPYF